jgi:RNA polymerase sigma-70 factor (ECF subfamily)
VPDSDPIAVPILVDHLERLCYTNAQPFAPAGVLLTRPTGASEVILVIDSVDEATLVEQAKTSPEAFGLLYEQYIDRIYSYIYYRTGNHHDAEDLTAKVFHQALKHIPRYVHRGAPFSSWLYRIAHNLVANWHRDRNRRQIVSLDQVASVAPRGQDGPFEHAARSERRDTLLDAIQHLPADRQQLLILKFVERLPNAQIGQIMGRSEGAIKSLYHRTLVALRDDLANRLQEPF